MAIPLTFATAKSKLGVMLDMDVSSGDYATHVGDWLNQGGERVWVARQWFGRQDETTVFTVAPYRTGTIAVAQEGTAVTGTGTTWAAGFTGRKLALGIGSPWYRFTRTGNTTGTIPTGGYAETTVTASNYVLFQDEFDLGATAETILDVQILHSTRRGHMRRMTMVQMDAAYYVNPMIGQPQAWGPTLDQTTATRRFRVSPVPDAIYRLRVLHVVAWTQLTAAGDLSVLGVHRERAWLLASALEAQRSGDARHVTSEDEVQAAIEEAWQKEQAASPMVVRRTPVGSGARWPMFYVNDDNIT